MFTQYIVPAHEDAGLMVVRVDQEARAGDIRTDMSQKLLLADLVVADLSIDKRTSGTNSACGTRFEARRRPRERRYGGDCFRLYTDRTLRYGLKDARPTPSPSNRTRRHSPGW